MRPERAFYGLQVRFAHTAARLAEMPLAVRASVAVFADRKRT
ncbi:hypothetical protein [Paraburkholderia silvatlantica]|nr:hypothetical protein [Paraburkholderia silvatlantica]